MILFRLIESSNRIVYDLYDFLEIYYLNIRLNIIKKKSRRLLDTIFNNK